MTPFKTPYIRTTTATRRAANPNRFVHISKWFEEDKDGDLVECHKTFKLSVKEKYVKLLKRKWFRNKQPYREDLVKGERP